MTKALKILEKAGDDLMAMGERLSGPIEEVFNFIKRHKKLIITLAVIYFVYKYLFYEEYED